MGEQPPNHRTPAETLSARFEALFYWLIGVVIITGGILGLPVYLLWNHSLVGAFEGVNEISFFQAWGITVLCIMLIRGPDRTALPSREAGKSPS